MADKKISQLALASTPLSGGETLPVVQTGATVQVSVSNLTEGRAVSATSVATGLGATGTPAYTFTGDTNTGMWSPTADTIAFSEGGAESMRITSAGRLGIGTTSPSARLHAVDASPTGGIVAQFNNSANIAGTECGIRLQQSTSSQLQCDLVTLRSGSNAGVDFLVKLSDSTGTPQTRFYITETGNVGIGTSSPTASLSVVGAQTLTRGLDMGITGVDESCYISQKRATVEGITGPLSTRMLFGTTSNHDTAVVTNNIERMRIASAGNVGINETAPDYRLDVNGTFGFTPGASVTPVDNGDVVFELTNNTTLTVKAKGSDGVVRSVALTLA